MGCAGWCRGGESLSSAVASKSSRARRALNLRWFSLNGLWAEITDANLI